jgi:hypothetical protein
MEILRQRCAGIAVALRPVHEIEEVREMFRKFHCREKDSIGENACTLR